MTTENILKILGALAALAAAGFVIKIIVTKKSTKNVQTGNKLSGGSKMAGRDIIEK